MMKWWPDTKLDGLDWLLLMALSFPAFYLLGQPALYIWDEAVYANASLDMANGSSWWIPVHGEYNTKPPLVLWLQAIMLKLIPSPEWAIRLPSALAVPGILFLITSGLKRWGFDRWSRILVMVCFVGHEGFIRHHISRTGDLDAVMVFFMMMYAMVFYDARTQNKWTSKHEVFFFLGVLCSFYAKSVAGWIMLAPVGVLWLLSPLNIVLRRRRFWLWTVLVLSVCLFYYLTRAMGQPDFLKLVWSSEYSRAVKNVMPWHEHSFSYYFQNFTDLGFFNPWIWGLCGALAAALFWIRDRGIKFHLLSWAILGLGYLTLISIPPVKLEWYDAPVYPFFAMILGVSIGYGAKQVPAIYSWLLLVPITLVMSRKINFISKDIAPRHPFEYEGAMLRQLQPTTPVKVFMPVETPEHRLQLDFYQKIRRMKDGTITPVSDDVSTLDSGDMLIIRRDQNIPDIQSRFNTDTIRIWPGLGYELLLKESKQAN